MNQKRVLLIIGGGIAVYKAPELVRQLKAQGLATRCLLTAAAEQFVSPLSLASDRSKDYAPRNSFSCQLSKTGSLYLAYGKRRSGGGACRGAGVDGGGRRGGRRWAAGESGRRGGGGRKPGCAATPPARSRPA